MNVVIDSIKESLSKKSLSRTARLALEKRLSELEKDIPKTIIKLKYKNRLFPFNKMRIGDSVYFKTNRRRTQHLLQTRLRARAKRIGYKISSYRIDSGLIIILFDTPKD